MEVPSLLFSFDFASIPYLALEYTLSQLEILW